jgi:hypothetical protein
MGPSNTWTKETTCSGFGKVTELNEITGVMARERCAET